MRQRATARGGVRRQQVVQQGTRFKWPPALSTPVIIRARPERIEFVLASAIWITDGCGSGHWAVDGIAGLHE